MDDFNWACSGLGRDLRLCLTISDHIIFPFTGCVAFGPGLGSALLEGWDRLSWCPFYWLHSVVVVPLVSGAALSRVWAGFTGLKTGDYQHLYPVLTGTIGDIYPSACVLYIKRTWVVVFLVSDHLPENLYDIPSSNTWLKTFKLRPGWRKFCFEAFRELYITVNGTVKLHLTCTKIY